MTNDKKISLAKLSRKKDSMKEAILKAIDEHIKLTGLDWIADGQFKLTIGIKPLLEQVIEASLMHVSEEEKCVELTPEELKLLKQGLWDLYNCNDEQDKMREALLEKLESLYKLIKNDQDIVR